MMAPQENDELDKLEQLGRSVSFFINGEKYTLSASVSPHMRLVDFIRDVAGAKGTKALCREGGCGACTVVATVPDLAADGGNVRTFNLHACQQLVYACSGWSIETIEGLGNRHAGYHKLQRSLAGFYGTQCGYCSPGMVMAAYGRSWSQEAYQKTCPSSGGPCRESCGTSCPVASLATKLNQEIVMDTGAVKWYQPVDLKGAYRILSQDIEGKTRLVLGNTGTGTWAGNLALKRQHPSFPSDVFVTLAAVNAEVTVADVRTQALERYKVAELLQRPLDGRLILSLILPKISDYTFVRSYKITPRAVNAHAYVNAAFRLPVDLQTFTVNAECSIVLGGISDTFVSAQDTQRFLVGRRLTDEAVVQEAIRRLLAEATPSPDPQQGSEAYRRGLVASLFYKTVVWVLKGAVPPALRSAGEKLVRKLGSGQQEFDSNEDTWPIGQPVPKLESYIQVSGEAEYAADLLPPQGELQGVFVQCDVANARIDLIDASDALAVPGVAAFITADDVSGVNSFRLVGSSKPDKIFASGRTDYAGQALGLIVAKTREIGLMAAQLVRVQYSDRKKPVLTIQEAIKTPDRVMDPVDLVTGKPESCRVQEGKDISIMTSWKHRIAGDINIGTQFHLTMEALHAAVEPMEDGYNISVTSQWLTETQSVVAQVLGVPANSLNLSIRRIGGGFGAKIYFSISLNLSIRRIGGGFGAKIYAGFNDEGILDALKVDLYSDPGYVNNDSAVGMAARMIPNVYASQSYDIRARDVKTDTAANTYCRTPGHVEGIAVIENVLDHVAATLDKDPLAVREANFRPDVKDGETNELRNTILPVLREKAQLAARKQQVLQFNKNNRWRKRGLAVTPLRYPFSYPPPFRYAVQVVIYEHDGTVALAHGGVEMGQGINTKAAQVAAGVLGVPLSLVKLKPNTSVAGANSFVTGGSFGSDLVCHGVEVCCRQLRARLDAVRATLKSPVAWTDLVSACLARDVDLSARYWTASKEHPDGYIIWAAAALEVELDVLTGQYKILRADIVEDVGRSMSPYVDVGQVEGAFVMGLGLFSTEKLTYNEDTGEKDLTGTWEYKVPTVFDVPEDLRVHFLSNASNPYGVQRSKATGEPPLCVSYVLVSALRQAIAAARQEAGVTGWFPMHTPMTVEAIQQLCLVEPEQFKLQ
ncbi:xanthine dehydrogenase 1 [Hyalella azteca]|uniref:Xanthine dehydrogenase 1 n=1 Tax=Hyalella azteca TaxID=294128 RepID=A0A979FJ59_HYAAZ|nr:xanthine dehydrogenase 1 [Hyalella azteca]